MAKKITIPSTLPDFASDWGGVNSSSADITVGGITVPAGREWGYPHAEVERVIKEKAAEIETATGQKVADFRTTAPDANNYVHLLCFATEADVAAYDSSHDETLALRNITIPISTAQVDSYVARLQTSLNTSTQYMIKDGGVFEVPLRFNAIHVVAATSTQEMMSGQGTLTVERSLNGTTWTTILTQSIAATDSTDTYPTSINLQGLLSEGVLNHLRLRVSFAYTDTEGSAATMSSTPMVLTVASVTLGVRYMTDWTRPVMAQDNAFPLSFAVSGAVRKWLHVTISGSLGTYTYVQEMSASQQPSEASPLAWTEAEKANIGILTHGVHAVTAWVTADDGSGHLGADGYPDSLISDTIQHRLMVVNENATAEELAKPRLMIQNVQTVVQNYVRTIIAQYAVWIPSSANPTVADTGKLPVSIRITDAAEGDTDYTTVYAQEDYTGENGLQNGQAYSLDTAIEIEGSTTGTQVNEYLAYLRIFRYSGDSLVNMLYESIRQRSITITVDNRENYAPTPGAWFVLNPRARNNSDANANVVINAATGEPIETEGMDTLGYVDDAWTTDSNGQKVFRVKAGSQVVFRLDPYADFNGDTATAIRSQMTLEMDFATNNITAEDAAVVDITQEVGGETLGMRLYPMEGWMKCSERQQTNDQDFGWQEGERTHLAQTINPNVVTRASDELPWMQTLNGAVSQPLALSRVYVNGYPEREMTYPLKAYAWASGGGHVIRIGNPNCDIDIYGIRILRTALSAEQVRQDVVASKPTSEEKQAVKKANAITANGRIDYALAKDAGYRCLTWVGQDQYKINQDKETGYAGYWRIDHSDPALSGTIGMAAYLAYVAGTLGGKKCLMITPQGSTANTYYENNGQTKLDKVTYVVNIPFAKVHADFGWTAAMSTGEDCANPMYLDGVRIEGTDYAGLSDEEKARVTINVVDGWFDGNGWSENANDMGMYHGQFYTVYTGGPKCQKLVNKINYASPMQSHKMGATKIYNDVMKAVLDGGMQLHRSNPEVRFAVYEESFLYFTENPVNNYKTEFHGMCTFGHGKFDKVVFGYKQNKNTFAFEGLNNNLPLCDFRVPADSDVVYVPADEAWSYNGTKSFEYGLGKTKEVTVDGETREYPTDANDAIFRRYVNFIYSHCTDLKYYNGTRAAFESYYNALVAAAAADPSSDASDRVAEMQKSQWWFTSGLTLVRFNYITGEWVDAGTWCQNEGDIAGRAAMSYAAGERNLSTYYMTASAYEAWRTGENFGDWAALNMAFRYAIAAHFADHFGTVGHVKCHLTHYNLVNFLLAGTDNCSKNLYYQYDPDSGLVFLDGDDLDSILSTDNNGRQTKVYFLDRIHDVADYEAGYKTQIDYEGRASALWNTLEVAYEETGTALRTNMREVLTAMAGLVSATDGYSQSVMGCMDKYFFSTQEYFPQVAYAEQGRIRYEFPKSFGYISYGNQARGIDPITQQVGSQLERERQYMKRRLALVASYACWGDFSAGVNTGVVGLADSGSALSLTPGSGRTGGNYAFTLTPHQWLYPVGVADRAVADPHVRVAPGQSYVLQVAASGVISGDSSVGLAALNYYRSIGNIGDMVVSNNDLSVQAARLTEFVAEPSDAANSRFTPGAISLTAPNLQRLSLKGVQTMRGAKDYTALTRAEEIDLRGTNITTVSLPQSQTLATLRLPATMTAVNLTAQPSLNTFTMEGYAAVQSMVITGAPLLATQPLATSLYNAQAGLATQALTTLRMRDVEWVSVTAAMVQWLTGITTCDLTGSIAVYEPSLSGYAINFNLKYAMLQKWGNVDDATSAYHRGLLFTYNRKALAGVGVSGESYTHEAGGYGYKVAPTVSQYDNAFTKVTWAVAAESGSESGDDDTDGYVHLQGGGRVRMDADTGVLEVADISVGLAANAVVTATVETFFGGAYDSLFAQKTVGVYDRAAALGDYVFADGSYSDQLDPGKTVVAIAFVVPTQADLDSDDTDVIITNKTDRQKRLAVALDDVTASATDGTFFRIWQWGPYDQINSAEYALYTEDAGTRYRLNLPGTPGYSASDPDAHSTSYDVSSIVNFTAGPRTMSEANYLDTATDAGIANNGFKAYAPGDGFGDGFAYQETSAQLIARDLLATATVAQVGEEDSEGGLALLSDYWNTQRKAAKARGDADFVVNSGYAKTLKLMKWRNDILAAFNIAPPAASPGVSELGALANLIVNVRADYASDVSGYPNKWSQLLVPAASAAYAYEPTVSSAEILADRFKAHNWFLPASGTLARIVWYHRRGYGTASTAAQNIFDKAYQAGVFRQPFRSINSVSASNVWTCSEYYSTNAWYVNSSGYVSTYNKFNAYAVRPVVAF